MGFYRLLLLNDAQRIVGRFLFHALTERDAEAVADEISGGSARELWLGDVRIKSWSAVSIPAAPEPRLTSPPLEEPRILSAR
jgi:hypothetical protein